MKRIALVMESSNVAGLQDLPGARDDAENWENFLRSGLGGSWTAVIVKNKPSKAYVEGFLERHKEAYCFVAFSGHGYHDARTNITKICLNEQEKNCNIRTLLPRGKRGTLISDACRGVEVSTESLLGDLVIEKATDFSKYGISKLASEKQSAKRLWFDRLEASPQGKLTMYSCQIGEEAGEYEVTYPEIGGYYTTALIRVAQKWEKTAAAQANDFTTALAHQKAVEYLSTRAPQTPQYFPENLHFPFAVKA